MEKVNIKLSAYESQLVDQAAIKIIQTIKSAGTKYSGPIPLPTKYEEFTIGQETRSALHIKRP